MEISWVVISYVLCITIQIFFCAYALLYTRRMRQSCSSEAAFLDTAEGFATARGSQGRWRIAWSFFAGGTTHSDCAAARSSIWLTSYASSSQVRWGHGRSRARQTMRSKAGIVLSVICVHVRCAVSRTDTSAILQSAGSGWCRMLYHAASRPFASSLWGERFKLAGPRLTLSPTLFLS
eukprot:146913-Rhodomonas_salina.1